MADFPSVIDVSTLDGKNGFKLSLGGEIEDGFSVSSAGDLNGDGIDDLIIGAPPERHQTDLAGASFVVFGRSNFPSTFDLNTLDGKNGFRLVTKDKGDMIGHSVASAGDVNGDGLDDVIVGAPSAYGGAGLSFVVLGTESGFPLEIDATTLTGSNGFRITGVPRQHEQVGWSVASAGDVNGDGLDDVIVGGLGQPTEVRPSYVVFGRAESFGQVIGLQNLHGANGFRIDGGGFSVSSAGDIDGDGIDDLIVGDPGTGSAYVVFGQRTAFAAEFDLKTLDGTNGFTLTAPQGVTLGWSVSSAGDLNGDGFHDLIVGDPEGGATEAGVGYVVLSRGKGFPAKINLNDLNGTNGFRLAGVDQNDLAGRSVSSAGDVNGDGFDDLIVGAPGAENSAGSSYVVFGKAGGFASILRLSNLFGANGFRIDGTNETGNSVSSAGDVNGDGFDDLIVGSYGGSYVVFGQAPTTAVNRVGSAGDQEIIGGAFDDALSGLGGEDTLSGGAGDDRLIGGNGGDELRGGLDHDWLLGHGAADTLSGGVGNDSMIGGEGADRLHGGAGLDTANYLFAYTAVTIDRVNPANNAGEAAGDRFVSVEHFILSGFGDTYRGGEGTDRVWGRAGEDRLSGGDGCDRIFGGDASDRLRGNGGNDTLAGGSGADTLFGGAGADSFVFLQPLDSAFGPRDVITDFSRVEGDVIDLAHVFAGKLSFIGGSAFTGAAGEVRTVSGGGGVQTVLVNIDGGEDAEMRILVDHVTSLQKGDFLL